MSFLAARIPDCAQRPRGRGRLPCSPREGGRGAARPKIPVPQRMQGRRWWARASLRAAARRLKQSPSCGGRFPPRGSSDPVGPRDRSVRSRAEASSRSARTAASTGSLARTLQAPHPGRLSLAAQGGGLVIRARRRCRDSSQVGDTSAMCWLGSLCSSQAGVCRTSPETLARRPDAVVAIKRRRLPRIRVFSVKVSPHGSPSIG